MKPVTLYDVAEYAGVSYQTVSRVVNQASHVSAKTREKVEAAMAQLNYIPNRVAQQLAGKQSLLIGVATSSLALHAPSQIVAAIKSRADQLGASVVVSMVERSGVEACKAAVHNLLAQRVSGLIIGTIRWMTRMPLLWKLPALMFRRYFLMSLTRLPSTVLFSPMKTVRDWAWSIWSHWVTSKSRC
ncbi:LacI family DNA-binding transcriptional regulator [Klebsiella oxytoca]